MFQMKNLQKCDKTPCTVVFASNEKGVVPLSMTLWSLLKNAKESTTYDVCILSEDISDASRKRCVKIAAEFSSRHKLRFFDIRSLFKDREKDWESICKGWPLSSWSRIFVPDILPEVNRVLYLDIDMLVCDDCSPLFEVDMQGAVLGVVYEKASAPGTDFNEKLGIPLKYPGYFNAGTLLMDTVQFRKEKLGEKLLDFAFRNKEILAYPDQDAMNAVLYDRVFRLHPRWNWNDITTRRVLNHKSNTTALIRGATFKEVVEASLYPGILHYCGQYKPWYYNYHITRERYEHAIRESRLPGFNTRNRWKFSIWLRRILYKPMYAYIWHRLRKLAIELGCTSEPHVTTWGTASDIAAKDCPQK